VDLGRYVTDEYLKQQQGQKVYSLTDYDRERAWQRASPEVRSRIEDECMEQLAVRFADELATDTRADRIAALRDRARKLLDTTDQEGT
jgi:hypothetical protein